MSLETDLHAALDQLVASRAYPSTFPQGVVYPAIRYTVISSVPVLDVCGDGDDLTAFQRVQIDIVETGYMAMRALRLQVMAEMRLFSPPATLEDSRDTFDVETRMHRSTLDYVFHGSSP